MGYLWLSTMGRLKFGSSRRRSPTARSRLRLASGPRSKRVGHADVPGANGLEESFRPRGQKQSARSIGRTRSGKAAHGMDLKVMGAAPTGNEAGATLLRMIQDSKRIAPSGTRKPSGVHLAGGHGPNEAEQEVGTERKRLRISDWITGVS